VLNSASLLLDNARLPRACALPVSPRVRTSAPQRSYLTSLFLCLPGTLPSQALPSFLCRAPFRHCDIEHKVTYDTPTVVFRVRATISVRRVYWGSNAWCAPDYLQRFLCTKCPREYKNTNEKFSANNLCSTHMRRASSILNPIFNTN